MAVASDHGIRSSEVELGVRDFQSILWSCAHQSEVRRVLVIIGLQERAKGNMNIQESKIASNANACKFNRARMLYITNVYTTSYRSSLFSLTSHM